MEDHSEDERDFIGGEEIKTGNRFLKKARLGTSEEYEMCFDELFDNMDYFDSDGKTALHHAAENGQDKVCKWLSKYISNKKDLLGATPLHYAAINGHDKCVNLLLKGCEDWRDIDGMTPLHWAAMGGHFSTCQFLRGDIQENAKDDKGWTALHYAAAMGRKEVCSLFIDLLPEKDNEGLTAADIAIENGHEGMFP